MYISLHSPTRYFFLAAALLIAPAATAWGAPVGNSCARANLPASNFYQGVFDRESLPAFVAGAQVPVYAQKGSDGDPIRRLTFGSRVFIVEPADSSSGTRTQVADYSDASNIYGWVDQQHLLCRRDPLRLDTGIWRRAFIKTETRVYEDSQGGCEVDACRGIIEFAWPFIYAERDGKLLVSESAQLHGVSANILGWLDSNDAILWNNASALRPSEKLDDVYPEDYVCAYLSPESINDPEQCRPVLGGERWFESNLRLPILSDVGDDATGYWRVLAQGAGSNLSRSQLLDNVLSTNSDANPILSNLDVMLVIDGSRSMGSVINAIQGTADNLSLAERLAKQLADKTNNRSNFRIGFQIYRDSRLNGPDGVRNSLSYSLADKPCRSDPSSFYHTFAEVKAQDNGWDSDFVENVYGGIMRGIKNLHSCPEHSKLIIVIGDHGYNSNKQSDRDHQSYSTSSIIRALYRDRLFVQPPILLFIQTPASTNNTNQGAYDSAYDLFADQARQLSEAWMLSNPQYKDLSADEFNREVRRAIASQFKRLQATDSSDQLLDAIVDTIGIGAFFNPDLSAEILSSGEATVEAIERMRKMEPYARMPILLWGIAKPTLRQSHQLGTFDTVQELYIPKSQSDKLIREVLVTDGQLNDWQGVLKAFRQLQPGRQTREQLLAVLKQKVGTNLGVNLDDTAYSDKPMGEILQLKSGLPYGFDSPILQYTENDIMVDMPVCELAHVVEVAVSHLALFDAIEQGNGLPTFSYEPLNRLLCISMSSKGRALRRINWGDISIQPLNISSGNQERSFLFSANNDRFYWLPIEWLP